MWYGMVYYGVVWWTAYIIIINHTSMGVWKLFQLHFSLQHGALRGPTHVLPSIGVPDAKRNSIWKHYMPFDRWTDVCSESVFEHWITFHNRILRYAQTEWHVTYDVCKVTTAQVQQTKGTFTRCVVLYIDAIPREKLFVNSMVTELTKEIAFPFWTTFLSNISKLCCFTTKSLLVHTLEDNKMAGIKRQ